MEAASDLDYLIGSETAKAIQFLTFKNENFLPFKKPESLFISINLSDRLFFSKENLSNFDVYEALAYLDILNKKSKEEEKLINNLLMSVFVNLLIDERKYSSNNPFKHNLKFDKHASVQDALLDFFKSLPIEASNVKVNNERYTSLSKLLLEFISIIKNCLADETLKIAADSNEKTFILKLNESSEETFLLLINYYLKIKGISTFLDFKWRSLSSGEQSYLSFMSRFHHLKHHENGGLKKKLIILIDEGDAGYHPEWQRKFFNTTLNFLSKLFEGSSVQLIFTANSPFLSSDLPKSSIIFLERIQNNKMAIIHSKDNNRASTFAANIHTLFSDSFYMDGVLIGEFAKNKINKIITYLGDVKEKKPRPELKKTIEQIGEPILRTKLLSMWNDKFGLAEELKTLEVRMAEIKLTLKIQKKIKK